MHRFFLPPECVAGDLVSIPGGLVHQLERVLRLKVGDRIVVLDDSGWEYEVELKHTGVGRVEGQVMEKRPATGEPRAHIDLYQGTLRAAKFELVLQKGTELGITAFTPVLCERSIARDGAERKEGRWRRIIQEAAEQSRRGRLPVLNPPISFQEACQRAKGFSVILWEEEVSLGLRSALENWLAREPRTHPLRFSLFIGPEGGFSPQEAEYARGLGIVPVSLGKRILRAETAGLVAAAAILYQLGDLG